ncbi:hypothetical protein DM01DRAFT_1176243 [Hesseltinella vesiculosa]|uniref:Tetraspanin Tsp2 n=1 Tax=Hesseltinella vesiculosa TaxID=101127 RepID=A0A1X2G613_9FUNG|nr:hypothetical protein DM01DRAFT_1176243 [Hesseltinella vesiculosa]
MPIPHPGSNQQHQISPQKRNRPTERQCLGWTMARWLLLLGNIFILMYSLMFLVFSVATYAKRYERAEVILITNTTIIAGNSKSRKRKIEGLTKDVSFIVSFTTSLVCLVTAAVGLIGVFKKNRRLLAIYCLLLWLCFALISSVGYIAFKGHTWNLKAKLGMRWRHEFSLADRQVIQDNLRCCGFENPSDHASYFPRCWAESLLPGCQYKYTVFEEWFLRSTFTVAFAILGIHILVIITSLLCANHVDQRFGNRPQPHITFLGPFKDWREWENSRKDQ